MPISDLEQCNKPEADQYIKGKKKEKRREGEGRKRKGKERKRERKEVIYKE